VVTFTFSEATTNFTVGDISATNGAISNFTGSGANYSATFTAIDGISANGSVSVTAGSYTDAAGNLGATDSDTVPIDTLNPTVSVNIVDTSLNDGDNSSVVTFTFSEATTNFAIGDISATNGTMSNFTGSGASYSATFTADDAVSA